MNPLLALLLGGVCWWGMYEVRKAVRRQVRRVFDRASLSKLVLVGLLGFLIAMVWMGHRG